MYEQGDAPTFSRAPWTDVKFTLGLDFPNLPYFIDGNTRLTETSAIMKYIAKKWKPELLGSTAEEVARAQMLENIVGTIKEVATAACYSSGDRAAIKAKTKDNITAIIKYMNQNGFAYLAGASLTYVDFIWYELMELLQLVWGEGFFTDYPELLSYHQRMHTMDCVVQCRAQNNTLPFNNKMAAINGIRLS